MEGRRGANFNDLLDSMFGYPGKPRPTGPSGTDARSRQADRQMCQEKGHRYQVHGKTNPSKVVCARCEVSWGIGPRTEPSS